MLTSQFENRDNLNTKMKSKPVTRIPHWRYKGVTFSGRRYPFVAGVYLSLMLLLLLLKLMLENHLLGTIEYLLIITYCRNSGIGNPSFFFVFLYKF